MPYFDFRWTDEIIAHLDEHGVSPEDFEEVVSNPEEIGESHSTRRPCCWGETSDVRFLFCVFEKIDDFTIVAGDCIRNPPPGRMKDVEMSQEPNVSPELLEQLQRERALIAAELDDLGERHDRMVEAKAEETGHLRRAIHRSGRLVREIAAEAGVSSQTLCEFLEGTRTLRSDVLDRLAQAVHATISVEPRRPERVPSSEGSAD